MNIKGPAGCHGYSCDVKTPPPPTPEPWAIPPTPKPTKSQVLDFVIGTPPPLPAWNGMIPPMGAPPSPPGLPKLPKMFSGDLKPLGSVPGPKNPSGPAYPDPLRVSYCLSIA